MNRPRTALVVAATPSLAARLAAWLEEHGYAVRVVKTYAAGKVHLDARPDSLVTELELGAYNGLQLALHARAERVAPVVVGPADVVLQREAAQLGIAYLRKDDLNGDDLRVALRPEPESDPAPAAETDQAWDEESFLATSTLPRSLYVH